MKWLLVALIMNTPVKTDLTYNSLSECLAAEAKMRAEWTEVYSQAKKAGTEPERLGQMSKAMTTGTCVPTK